MPGRVVCCEQRTLEEDAFGRDTVHKFKSVSKPCNVHFMLSRVRMSTENLEDSSNHKQGSMEQLRVSQNDLMPLHAHTKTAGSIGQYSGTLLMNTPHG